MNATLMNEVVAVPADAEEAERQLADLRGSIDAEGRISIPDVPKSAIADIVKIRTRIHGQLARTFFMGRVKFDGGLALELPLRVVATGRIGDEKGAPIVGARLST